MLLLKDKNLVHNPNNEMHFFQWKIPAQRISIYVGETLLASSTQCLLIKEIGYEVYDGIYYFPKDAINAPFFTKSETHSHCPLKGEAQYYHYRFAEALIEDIAWYYSKPIAVAMLLKDYVAFYPDKVTFVIEPIA